MIIPHSGVLTKFNGGRGGIATSPLKSTTSKASVKKWKPTARAACSNRRPSRGRMISSSTSAVLRPTRHPRRIRSDDGAITGRGEDPFVKAMGAEKGKLREPWHPMRLHHIGIVLPTLEKAHDFIETNGLEVDYSGFVDAYHADLIFTKKDKNSTPIEFIIPREGVLKDFNHGKGGIATSPLKSTTSKRYGRSWKASSRAACWKRKPFKAQTTSLSTSAVPARTPASSSNTSKPLRPLIAAIPIRFRIDFCEKR